MVQLAGKEITLERLYRAFEVLKSWEERYKYVIDLGRKLPELPAEYKVDENYVHGCSSAVWMVPKPGEADGTHFQFLADSDSHIVKGLIAIIMICYYDKSPEEIVKYDIKAVFEKLDLENHLSATRSNGFFAMVKKLKMLAVDAASKS